MAIAGLWRALSSELYAAKLRTYLREARRRRKHEDYFSAGIYYQRAARAAQKVKKPNQRYVDDALACFEMDLQHSLGSDNYSQAADALEKIAKIHEQSGDTQLAAELRLQASYLRLRGIEATIS